MPPLFSSSTSETTLVGVSAILTVIFKNLIDELFKSANEDSSLTDELDNQFQSSKGSFQDESEKPAAPSARVLTPGPSSPNISPYLSGSPPQTPARSPSPQGVASPRASPTPLVAQTLKPPDAARNDPPKNEKNPKVPRQFSRHVARGSLNMGRVESPPPEVPAGLSGWFKKKLQNFVGPP